MKKEDQRVRLSKQLLRNGLISLLKEKSIHKISVREICDTAEINRTTFYKYYGSQYDLLEDIETVLLDELSEKITDNPDKQQSRLVQILYFISDNKNIFKLLVNNNIDIAFPQKMLYLPEIQKSLSEFTKREEFAPYSDYTYEFLVNGGYCIIRKWINQEKRESPEELADYIYSLYNSMK